MNYLNWIVISIGAVFTLILGGAAVLAPADLLPNHGPRPQEQIQDRIERECKREFAAQGELKVLNCRIAVSAQTIENSERAKLGRAYDRSQ